MKSLLFFVDEICKRVGRNCFEIVIDNFNGIHTFIGIENAAHITGDRIA